MTVDAYPTSVRLNGQIITLEQILAALDKPKILKPIPRLDKETAFRLALAHRDIAAVYRALQRVGVSQRRIAAATGQSQSEISEILAGRRVVAYDLLARIADGLNVQRGMMGLAYDDETVALLGAAEERGSLCPVNR